MSKRQFDIYKDGSEIPVVYTDEALADFKATKSEIMDREIDKVRDTTFGADSELDLDDGRLGIVAHIMGDALEANDNRRLGQCVLWIATRHPHITSLNILFGRFYFQSIEAADGTPPTLH
jgi:hypothetical protein